MESLGMSGPISKCRGCGDKLVQVFADLGSMPPANSYLPSSATIAEERSYPLCVRVCGTCFLAQVDYDVPPEELFGNYAYFSSYSDSWLAHARNYCEMAKERFGLNKNSFVVELASNDGYLLKNFVSDGIPVLGIDPSDTVAAAAERIGVPTRVDFFSKSIGEELAEQGCKADLILGNNVLAHVPDTNDFVAGIAALLKPGGSVTIEFPHLLKLIEHVEFDTIYHEHYSYLSLLSVEKIFARHGLRIYDVEELSTHGGSLRIFACHASNQKLSDGNGLLKVRADEKAAGLGLMSTYANFAEKIEDCRKSLREFFRRAKSDGFRVAGYGAAAKGNTLLNFCRASVSDVEMVADRNPHKQGKLLPGTHIPTVSPEVLLAAKPDYLIILPWNLRDEIMRQLAEVRDWGGRFVTPVPTVRIFE
jgi:SAM-dependent methyltransferase